MMDSFRNSCRFCLKLTSEVNLTPLFENYGFESGKNVVFEWHRMFSFIYDTQGLPDKICSNCKAQAEWILNFQRQCYESDAILRMNQIKFKELEIPEHYKNIYEDDNNEDTIGNDQLQAAQEYGYDIQECEKYEDDQMTMEYTNEIFPETDNISSNEQEHLDPVDKFFQSQENYILQDATEFKEKLNPIMENIINEKVSQKDANIGILETSKSSNYNCPICGKPFAYASSLNRHRKKHENPKPFACTFSECDKKFSEKQMRDAHIKTVHEKRTYKCPACKCKAKYRRTVALHILKEHPGSRLQPLELET